MNAWNKCVVTAITCVGFCLSAQAKESNFPTHPITLIVPYSPGGAADIVGRMIADKAATILGQPIIVSNRPGAGGALAGGVVAKAPPDGYTLLLTTVAIAGINPHMEKLNYSPVKDLAPVAIVATAYTTLVVNKSSPFHSVADLVAYGKRNPGKLNYGSSGKGSITDLTAELFSTAAGIRMTHVPYRGNPQVITDLVGGQIQLTFDGSWMSNVKGGLVRALAYTGPTRNSAMPDIPTMAEAGLPSYKGFEPWIGVAAPAGTPKPTLAKLTSALLKASEDPRIVAQLEARGMEPRHIGSEKMTGIIQSDYAVLGEVIARSGAGQ